MLNKVRDIFDVFGVCVSYLLSQTTGERIWTADIPGMNTFVCDEQMLNILDDGMIIISGGTHGGGVFAFSGSSPIDLNAPTPKYGMDQMLTGTYHPRNPKPKGV